MEFSPFRVLDLPFVSLREVALCWDPYELMNIYHSSKRMKNAIKSMPLKNKYKTKIYLSFFPKMWLRSNGFGYGFLERRRSEELENLSNCCHLGEAVINKVKIIFNDVLELFGCKVHSVHFDDYNLCKRCILSMMDWLISLQASIDIFTLKNITDYGKEVFYLTQKLKINKALLFGMLSTSDGWDSLPVKFDVDFLQLDKWDFDRWFSIDDIIFSNCIVFDFGNLQFSVFDINRFIKSWIQGSNSRMKYFRVNSKLMDYHDLINGIQVIENDRLVSRTFTYYGPELLNFFEFVGGSDVQSISGKRATFQQDSRMEYTHDGRTARKVFFPFQMVVWDD
uniref:F-box domain-containing protein n=1 Tax=Caenorhabditis tropicalis TaxID=1561998 RepID=A0A1I7U8K8_9PELO